MKRSFNALLSLAMFFDQDVGDVHVSDQIFANFNHVTCLQIFNQDGGQSGIICVHKTLKSANGKAKLGKVKRSFNALLSLAMFFVSFYNRRKAKPSLHSNVAL